MDFIAHDEPEHALSAIEPLMVERAGRGWVSTIIGRTSTAIIVEPTTKDAS